MALTGDGVSVVVPAYNAAGTIARSLASIAAQTVPPTEVIVVDDASTDGTADIAERAGIAGLSVLRLPDNRGPGRARNVGTRVASGEWIAFLDADDEWLPELLERAVAAACVTGAQVVGCGGIRVMLERDGSRTERRFVVRGGGDVRDVTSAYWMLVGRHGIRPLSPAGMLVRRDVLARVGGFPEDMRRTADTVLNARLWLHERVWFVDRVLYHSAQRPDSLSVTPPSYADTVRLLVRLGMVLVTGVVQRRPGTRWLVWMYPRTVWQRHRRWLRGILARATA